MRNHYYSLKSLLLSGLFGGLIFTSFSQSNQLKPVTSNQVQHAVHSGTIQANTPAASNVPTNLPTAGIQGQTMNANSGSNYVINTNGEPCATDYIMEAYLQNSGLKAQFDAQYQEMVNNIQYSGPIEKVSYTFPIIFHVVYNPSHPVENVSNAAIMALFNQLNTDYQLENTDQPTSHMTTYGFSAANVDVNFCLAARDPQNNPLSEAGVQRVTTTQTYFDPNTQADNMKATATGGTPSWDRTKYINVWICNISNGASSGVAGYAYRPTTTNLPSASQDGIVVDYSLGMPVANRVLSHEMGHFFGLAHTWGNSNNPTDCSQDDGIADTPNTLGPSFDYPGSCSGNQSTCSGVQTQYENFMDYSSCTCMFTTGQVSLMHQIMSGIRISLTTSDACTPVNNAPPVADFIADITTVISGGVVNFTDQSTNYPTSWSWAITPGTGWAYSGSSTATSQNPSVQFTTPGTYTVALTATNIVGPNTKTKTNYITVVAGGGGTTACDTLRNYTATELNNATAYGITGGSGYYPGNIKLSGGNKISRVAEQYTASAPSQFRAVRIPVIQINDMGAANNITFKVYSDASGLPGTALGSEVRTLASLNVGYWNVIEFATPVSVSGTFWVSAEWLTTAPFDTIVFLTTDFSDRAAGLGTSACYESGGVNWLLTSSLFGGSPNGSLTMDALLSNGPAPTASLYMSTTTTCVGSPVSMNGYGSTNASSYVWYFDDGTNNYYDPNGSFTYTFPVGTWNIELDAQASCITDTALATLTVNPAIVPHVTTTGENCTAGDGTITVAPTGGDGSGYNVSINSGGTFDSSSPYNFTGLTAGTYTTIINDGTACADTVSTIVANVNNFNPTLAPGTTATINAGNSVTFTVTGGTTWVWYQGNFDISTTSSVTVSPTTTTTYQVVVEDGSGCSKTFDITVTVNGSSAGIDEHDLNQMINVYPNPSRGTVNLAISLDKTQNLQVRVYSLIGSLVYEKDYSNVDKAVYPIDLSDKGDGAYLIRITSDTGTVTKRIVVAQ